MGEQSLFCDGGVIGRNPSPHGGTWAWCLVKNDEIVRSNSGLIENPPTTSNNFTELYAAITAIHNAPEGFCGTLYTDSQITRSRLTGGTGFNGIPQWLRLLTLDLRRNRKWQVKILAGHPTKRDLARGYKTKNLKSAKTGKVKERQVPVSKWNVWCDKQCQKLAREFMEKRDG